MFMHALPFRPQARSLTCAVFSAFMLILPAVATGIFEMDLIFPRHEAFAPLELLPISFAIQNPAQVEILELELQYAVIEIDSNSSYSWKPEPKILSASLTGFSNDSEPYIWTTYARLPAGAESSWFFSWGLRTANCTTDGDLTPSSPFQSVYFNTSNGASALDLGSVMTKNTCASTESFVYNVTVPFAPFEPEGCAASGPPPAANPCAVTINSSAASKIWASATATFCSLGQVPNSTIKCPPFGTGFGTGNANRAEAGLGIWTFAMISGLVSVWLL